MTISSRFDAISPLDSRFYGGDTGLYAALHPFLSEEGRIRAHFQLVGTPLRIEMKSARNPFDEKG